MDLGVPQLRSEASYLKIQRYSELVAIVLNWVLIIAFVLDFTNIKVLVVGDGAVSTFTLWWWMKWERARLPK